MGVRDLEDIQKEKAEKELKDITNSLDNTMSKFSAKLEKTFR